MLSSKVVKRTRRTLLERVIDDMIQREESTNVHVKAKEIKDYLEKNI